MNTDPLEHACTVLLAVADAVSHQAPADPPPGEWTAEQVLGHLSLVLAATLNAVSSIAGGTVTTYDNRIAQDTWTINHVADLLGGPAGVATRLRLQSAALTALVSGLTEHELSTTLPTLLVSHDQLLVHDQLPLSGLLDGLVGTELPAHTEQLRALL